MKSLIFTLALALFSISIMAQSYYWVGNGGNWSDLSHWATTSGGANFHNVLPGPTNDVIFDANSFTMPGQVVTIDLEQTYCRDFISATVTNNPYITSQGFYDNINVYGDFNLSPNFGRFLSVINLRNTGVTNITTGELNLGGSTFVECLGGGEYHLQDSISTGNVYVVSGSFHTNNHAVHTTQRFSAQLNNNQEIFLGTSNIYTWFWDVWPDVDLDASNATIYYGGPGNYFETFNGQGHHFNHVVFIGSVDISGNNSYDIFEARPGSTLNLTSGSTQTAQQFLLDGNGTQSISILSSVSGQQATLQQNSGIVNGQYLILTDNNATGGATFNANESINLGNNSGWNITISVPQNYYWVGGSGDWNEATNWATTSGGSTLHTDPPSAIDDVFFDSNSFSGPAMVQLGSSPVTCKDFNVTGVGAGVSIEQLSTGQLHLYGSLELDPNANYSLRNIHFLSNEVETINTNDVAPGEQCDIEILGSGSFSLLADFFVWSLEIFDGSFNSNGHSINADFQVFMPFTLPGNVSLANSVITTRSFINDMPISQLNVDNTEFIIRSSFHGNGDDYYKVTCEIPSGSSEVYLYSFFSVEELIVVPGSIVAVQSGATITVNELELNGTEENPIIIKSSQPGNEGYFSKSSGTVDGYNLQISDNHAIGGAVFNAYESEFENNVVGWNLITSVEELPLESNLQVYPNPTSDFILFDATAGSFLVIYDLSGRIVLNQRLNEGLNRVSVNHLSTGIYTAMVQDNNASVKTLLMVK
jgi:hypothetical protein